MLASFVRLVALLQYGEDRPRINQRISGHTAAAAFCGWFREPFQTDPCRVPLGRRYTSPPLRAACAGPRPLLSPTRFFSASHELRGPGWRTPALCGAALGAQDPT